MVQSVERSLTILDTVARYGDGIGVLELSKKVGLPLGTVHRLLATLVGQSFIRQDKSTGRYMVGYKIFEMASRPAWNRALRNVALPYLKELKEKSGETAHIVVADGDCGLCVESVESSENIRSCSPVGGKSPFHCTAVGKVLLAYMPDKERERIISRGLEQFTGKTITTREVLEEALAEVRKAGVAFDDEEYELGARCIAAPVFDGDGNTVAAVGISGSAARVTYDKRPRLTGLVVEAARMIAQDMYGSAS